MAVMIKRCGICCILVRVRRSCGDVIQWLNHQQSARQRNVNASVMLAWLLRSGR
ncbi:hypothetical protein J4727_14290 [Providencia rettgeri]|uniref:Uncharacterized protein n=1 Tax=Providencia rettgeri TaxID=587 RepID=A0A939SRI5_PRORE|nr:hypothetical protein [Providencia rettgeri]